MLNNFVIFASFCTFVVIVQIINYVIPWIYKNFVGPMLIGSRINLKEMGSWALVTGATDGIGKAYAMALAQKGLNLVLVSRSLEKLQNVANEIASQFNVETKVIDVDFTAGPDIYDKISENIQNLEIGVLVNNVGMSVVKLDYFLSLQNSQKQIQNIVTCNILSVTNMCRITMPQMVQRKRGLVINISSVSAVLCTPLLQIYAATKAFINKFSDDLATEYTSQGVMVQCVSPGPVATNMLKTRKSNWMACSPETFVKYALNTLGFARHTTGYYPHSLMVLGSHLVEATSTKLNEKLSLKIMTGMRDVMLKYEAENIKLKS